MIQPAFTKRAVVNQIQIGCESLYYSDPVNSHDAGTKLRWHKMKHGLQLFTRCRFDISFMLGFPLSELYTLIIGDNIYHSENASSNRDHSAETVELRYDFKLLRLAFLFQTHTVSVAVSHFFMPVSCERDRDPY